ncbi:MAG: hypothetical protein NTW32_14595, partial [Chloroflexi bacterium]|nr:hypothetical protein [Chloroflexota bacterium]
EDRKTLPLALCARTASFWMPCPGSSTLVNPRLSWAFPLLSAYCFEVPNPYRNTRAALEEAYSIKSSISKNKKPIDENMNLFHLWRNC